MSLKKQTIVSKGVFNDALSLPNDFVWDIPAVTPLPFCYINKFDINENTNMIIRKVGVFSNFADGLVPKNRGEHLPMTFNITGYDAGTLQTGTVTVNAGNQSVVGAGTNFMGEFSVSDVVSIPGLSATWLMHIKSITDNTNMDLTEYPLFDHTGENIALHSSVGGGTVSTFELPVVFNHMFTVDEFIPILTTIGTTAPSFITVRPQLLHEEDIDFLTDSISTDYDGEDCFIDIVAEVEYTA